VFWRVALPLARPAVAVGAGLALLEALNDIGASEFLGVRTLTVSVYATWVTRSDLAGATQMALVMLLVVLALVYVEFRARARRRYTTDAQHPRRLERVRLAGTAGGMALVATVVPIAIGFLAPTLHLLRETLRRLATAPPSAMLVRAMVATVAFACLATALTVAAGLVVAYAARLRPGWTTRSLLRLASLGYAVPGTVLAIGLLPVVTTLDPNLWLLSSGGAVVMAYLMRFLAIPAGGIDAGLGSLAPSLDEAARLLGDGPARRLWRVHLPLVRPAIGAAAALVFVDAMKELPATLLLRPVGVETLATHLYGEAARGTYEEGAMAALLIVLAGLVPVVVLTRMDGRR
jgi:iron(III) transport system permease protein